MVSRRLAFSLIFAVLGVVIIACQGIPSAQTSKPTVIIASPPSGSLYSTGEEVVVQSTATDPSGVTKVALIVDGAQIREDPSPVSAGQAQFSVLQSWIATSEGQHNLTVRATNSQGVTADSGILINVKAQSGLQPTTIIAIATAVPLATFTSTPVLPPNQIPSGTPQVNQPTPTPFTIVVTATPPNTLPAPSAPPCTYNAKFIADLTIPDGTVFTPGAVFAKSWRVQNTGTCEWDNASLVFVSGTQMASGAAYPVPTTPTGATADLTVPMTAPANYGAYNSIWRIRNSSGQVFGTNLTVVINVPSPATAIPPTNTPAPTIPSGCSGQPNNFNFSANPGTINKGQSTTLQWDQVNNADTVLLDGGQFSDEGITTPGNRTVSPDSTTTYTITATCKGGLSRKKSVTVTVNTTPGGFAGHWDHNFGSLDFIQLDTNVGGKFNSSLNNTSVDFHGTVSGNTLDGQDTSGDVVHITLGNNGDTFTGTWNGVSQLCGAKAGVSFPSNCAYDGTWNSGYGLGTGPLTNSTVKLSQVGFHVSGTYTQGNVLNDIDGNVTFIPGFAVLTGTWTHTNDAANGNLTFYIATFTFKQFQGNWDTSNEWCGWRGGAGQPNPCLK